MGKLILTLLWGNFDFKSAYIYCIFANHSMSFEQGARFSVLKYSDFIQTNNGRIEWES